MRIPLKKTVISSGVQHSREIYLEVDLFTSLCSGRDDGERIYYVMLYTLT